MPTVTDLTLGTTGGGVANDPYSGLNKMLIVKGPKVTLPAAFATGDTVNALPVKKGWIVRAVHMLIVTAAVGTATVDVGLNGGTDNGFLDATDVTAAAGTMVLCPDTAAYPAAGGVYVTADSTINILAEGITSMTTPATLQLIAIVQDLN